ncbi:MAG: winged helix-turn-helix domain-containing protein [Desulfomonile sp.]|nr:winged helix-turn-helix domain-containing protein [Desulfomonile sp.]
MGLTLPRVGGAIGRSRAAAARSHAQFRAWCSGRQDKGESRGGRRRAYLTFEEEREFLSGFFEVAPRGGILVVNEVRAALEERLGHTVAETAVYRMLERHDWRKIVPRRRRPKADTSGQEGFKKTRRRGRRGAGTAGKKEEKKECPAYVSGRSPLRQDQ